MAITYCEFVEGQTCPIKTKTESGKFTDLMDGLLKAYTTYALSVACLTMRAAAWLKSSLEFRL
jgi:hypothetical protein